MSAARVFPVGRQLDVLPADPAGRGDAVGHLQLGLEVVTLSRPAQLVWSACHALPTYPAGTPWGRPEADALSARWGLDDAGRVQAWAELAALGAVSTVDDDDEARRTWAGAHSLHPLLVGLGDSPEQPGVFRIGLPEESMVTLPLALYEVWAWGSLSPDLAGAVDWHAAAARDAGSTDPDAVDADRLLAGVVAALHPLLSVSAACLDLGGAR